MSGTTSSAAGATPSPPANARRILIAEPEAAVRAGLTAMLADDGFDVVGEADDGEQAVAMARTLRPDLVIMDVTLTKKDGIEAAKEIAGDRIAPIVMIAAGSHRELVIGARDAGALGYLRKPVSRASLLPALEVAIARYGEAAALRALIAETTHRLETRKVIDRAKGLLMAQYAMTEPEAFRWIQRTAMDRRATSATVATAVIDELSPQQRRAAS